MEVEKTLRPGSDGTKRFVERFGSPLVCVRHRVDRQQGLRYTTVELIVDRRLYTEPTKPDLAPRSTECLPVRINDQEHDLRRQVRAAGAHWAPQHRVWLLSPDAIDRLDLRDRLV
jgi:hypothetical protein